MRPRAVLLDALGTMLELEPPAPALRMLLRERFGIDVSRRQADDAIAAEIAFYRRNLGTGRDTASVAELRRRCARVLSEALGPGGALTEVAPDQMVTLLLDALVFTPFSDVRPALTALRAGGLRLVAVSNWDASLPDTLARTGLLDLLDGVVSSAACGAAKPDPRPFAAALRLVDVAPGEAVHVGDSLVADVHGALAAGVVPILLTRERSGVLESGGGSVALALAPGDAAPPPGVASIASLAELPALVLGPRPAMARQ